MKLESENIVDDLTRWSQSFIEHMNDLSYSKNTLELYGRVIGNFTDFIYERDENLTLSSIKSIHITKFLNYLENISISSDLISEQTGFSKSTKNTYIKAIRNYFNFISSNNDDLYSFDRVLNSIKMAGDSDLEEKLDYLDEKEIERLLEYIEKKIRSSKEGSRYNFYRNSLFVKLMLFAGLRASEALNMRLVDFDMEYGGNICRLGIIGKGGKKQFAYIKKENITEELDYFSCIKETHKSTVLTLKNGKKWNRSNAFLVVNNIYKNAMIKKSGLHILRHSLAMRMTKKKVPLVTIKKLLRHKNIATTTIYSKATSNDIDEALDNF